VTAEANEFGPKITPGDDGSHRVVQSNANQRRSRDGPSRTQIVTTDASKETGWTNSYLPSTPPSSVAKSAGVGE
jgi:hypothetical protein